jgi:HIV Tat-specific factor 1
MRLMLPSNFLFIFIRSTKNILTLQADEDLLSELEVDVREECAKFGPVDNVKVCLATDIFLF